MSYDENEVWFLNSMEQGLLRYLPDAYREVAEITSRPVKVNRDGHESEGIIPEYVEVKSPDTFGLWVRFTFDVHRRRVSGGLSGPDYRSVYKVTATTKKGVSASASTDDAVFRTRDQYPCGPSFFMGMARDTMKGVFGVMTGVRSFSQSLIPSALALNEGLMTGFREHVPDEWNVGFRQSILKDYGIPFVDGIEMALGDDGFTCPVKVNTYQYAMPEIRFPDTEDRFFVNLEDSPEDLRAFVSDETRKVAYSLVEHLGSMIDLRKKEFGGKI